MLKIFYNKTEIFLVEDPGMDNLGLSRSKVVLSYRNRVERREIISYIESETLSLEKVWITGRSFEHLKQDFLACFTIIAAAGGVILNERNELLLIYRKGKWDIPKGKIEEGESNDVAAIREVGEETGISQVEITHPLADIPVNGNATWHFYRQKGERVLKPTYWFEMRSNSDVAFIPQQEEGIERIQWTDRSTLSEYYNNSYGSIRDVLELYRL